MHKGFIILIFICNLLIASEIDQDSLWKEVKTIKSDQQFDFLIDFCNDNYISNPHKSLIYAKLAYKIAKKKRNYENKFKALNYIGLSEKILGNYQSAIKYHKESLEIIKKLDDEQLKAIALTNIAINMESIEEFEQAIYKYFEVLEITQKLGLTDKIILTYNNIGRVYFQKGDYEKALEYTLLNLKLAENSENKNENLAQAYDGVGIIYFNLSKFLKAEEYFRKSLELRIKLGNKRMISNSYNNISTILAEQEKYDEALVFLEKSVKIRKDLKLMSGVASTFNNMGEIYKIKKKYDKALEYYEKSLEIKRKFGNEKDLVPTKMSIGDLYDKTGDSKKCIGIYKDCLKISFENNYHHLLVQIYFNLSRFYAKQNNFIEAYHFQEKFSTLNDSLYSEESQLKIAELELQYETEKKERQIEFLTKEKEKQKIIKKFLILILIIIFAGLTLLYILYSQKKKEILFRKKIEKQIRDLNKNLEKRVQEELNKRNQQQVLLMQKSKLEALGRLSAGIAHEVNQPIARLSLGLDNILVRKSMQKLDDNYLETKLNSLFSDIERIKKLLDHIRIFSRDQSKNIPEKLDINQVINNAVMMIKTQYKNHNVEIKFDLTEPIPKIWGNKFRLEQVVMNLLANAKDAVEEKYSIDNYNEKEIIIRTYFDEDKIIFEVKDTGIGISSEEQEKIFDPFFTTKEPDKGTGLGLSISYGIIQEMGGEIEVESKKNEFTILRVIFKVEKY
ncbi:MAG: tetratricopeptide repeat protein [Candidatus Cloacimonetes bacterium]|nr:tetratricopeptide repeat protein [Candidatus Cloacimonadota bacterium]